MDEAAPGETEYEPDLRAHVAGHRAWAVDDTGIRASEPCRCAAHLVTTDAATQRYEALVAAGMLERPRHERRPLPTPIQAAGPVSDLIAR